MSRQAIICAHNLLQHYTTISDRRFHKEPIDASEGLCPLVYYDSRECAINSVRAEGIIRRDFDFTQAKNDTGCC